MLVWGRLHRRTCARDARAGAAPGVEPTALRGGRGGAAVTSARVDAPRACGSTAEPVCMGSGAVIAVVVLLIVISVLCDGARRLVYVRL